MSRNTLLDESARIPRRPWATGFLFLTQARRGGLP
jgi:hypothetical protein